MKEFLQFVGVPLEEAKRTLKMSSRLYDEFVALEMDTLDHYSPPGKKALADALNQAKFNGREWSMPFSEETRAYLLDDSIKNIDDIAKDNGRNGIRRALRTLRSRIE